jgi:hypothetical protein
LRAPSRTAVITLWTVGLIAALGIAAYIQVSQQKSAAVAMDTAPPPAAAAPASPQPLQPAAAPTIVAESRQTLLAAPPTIEPPPPPERPAPAAKAPARTPPAAAPKAAELPKTQKAAAAHKPAADRKLPADVAHLRVQLNHAYNQAVKAGVPRSVLKARRVEWNVLYAKAQKKSPEAVAQLYKTRAAELDALSKRQHVTRRKTN